MQSLMTETRPSWNEYFMKMAFLVSERSTCRRRKVGAVLVRDKRILATGYNGPPAGQPHCLDIGCLREELNIPSGERHELCRAIHAEANCLLQCALHGVSTKDSVIYITNTPCIMCSKELVAAHVKKVFVRWEYPDSNAMELLYRADIEVCRL